MDRYLPPGDGMEKHREDNGVVLEQDGKIHDPNDMAGRRSIGRCVGEGRCRMLCTVRNTVVSFE